MKNLNLNSILIIAGFAVLIYCLPGSAVSTNTVREIENRIHDTIIKTNTIKERIANVDLTHLEDRIDSLISARKTERDTVTIIKYQDRIIEKQIVLIDTLKVGILDRDSIIDLQDYTIAAQDTIIKKKKKQVVKSVAVALLATIIAVVK